jgi:hypothetical protein
MGLYSTKKLADEEGEEGEEEEESEDKTTASEDTAAGDAALSRGAWHVQTTCRVVCRASILPVRV